MPVARSLRRIALTGTAAAVLIAGVPALAQELGYESSIYDSANQQPAAEDERPIAYIREPVVQPLPGEEAAPVDAQGAGNIAAVQPPSTSTDEPPDDEAVAVTYQDEPPIDVGAGYYPPVAEVQPAPAPQPGSPYHPAYPVPGSGGVVTYHGPGYTQLIYPPMPYVADREAWIADCQTYLRERRRQVERSGAVGAVVGAAAGGLAGNRIADGARLGGTLLGAGIGGLAGFFIGQAIAQGDGDQVSEDCNEWFARYREANGYDRFARGQTGWGGGYIVVPQVTVTVYEGPAMVPVVREIIRETWVDRDPVAERPAVSTVKRQRIKGK